MARAAVASKAKSHPPAQSKGESAELLTDVKAFASQLGLDSGEHAFDDFAPQQSKQKLAASKRKHVEADLGDEEDEDEGNKAAASKKKRSKSESGASKASNGQVKETAAAGAGPVIPPVSDGMAAVIKERTWNTGVGPRPGHIPFSDP